MSEMATLVLNITTFRERISELLVQNALKIHRRLYIQLHPPPTPKELLSALPVVYAAATQNCPDLDVRLLLGVDKPNTLQLFADDIVEQNITKTGCQTVSTNFLKQYDRVVIGGTFDRIHYGHKLLLSTAALLANQYVVCGVTDKKINHKKILYELIEPVEKRIANVQEFIEDVTVGVELRAEPIEDPFGPSVVDKELQCIVVSPETRRGGDAVNEKRKERGLSTLQIEVISLMEGNDTLLKETKLSSNAARRRTLGHQLRPPKVPAYDYAQCKYVIGLTGGICAGKTHISNFLAKQGCEIIDCDKIGHEVLKNSEQVRQKIADTFGQQLVIENQVDRKALGAYVFQNKRLKQLTDIMWPIMGKIVVEKIQNIEDGKIIVVDAAVLLEAGWDKFTHAVWTTIVPIEEAIKRVMDRDHLTKEQAQDRINSQLTNCERVQRSNVVICSLWNSEETERQVLVALEDVRQTFSN